jgi:predicted protein tyrosine phosphatase
MNILFVCSRNQIRSVTAERIYARDSRLAVRSAGTANSARHRVSENDIAWADTIFVFEHRHKQQMQERFGDLLNQCQLVVLGIPDEYQLMNAELVEEIQAHVDAFLAEVNAA